MNRLNVSKLMVMFVAMLAMTVGLVSQSSAEPAKTQTIAEIYANKAKLNGKVVVVKGKVIKVNEGIMKNNWVHIEDGTGSGEQAKIVFRSEKATAKVGDEVTAQGTIELDKDFGMGYFYPVIAEDSSFTK